MIYTPSKGSMWDPSIIWHERTYHLFSMQSKWMWHAVSPDGVHWSDAGPAVHDPDPRWYDDTKTGRWDCIWAIPKAGEQGYWGYLTARPSSKTRGIRSGARGACSQHDAGQGVRQIH